MTLHLRKLRPRQPLNERILDFARARSMMGLLEWGEARGLNTYHLALDGRAGPRVTVGGVPCLMLSSYDYLGLAADAEVTRAAMAAVERYGAGTGGVRLLTGTNTLHGALERRIAETIGTEDAMVTGSGFLANLAAIPTLTTRDDLILADELAHRSLVDACRLSAAELQRFPHNDLAALTRLLRTTSDRRRRLVVVDGVYSMEGDLAPLAELRALTEQHGASLLVDEAHALGVLGRRGAGSAEHAGIPAAAVDVWTGSLSKALGSQGGYVAGSAELIRFLRHEAAPYVFSGALAPAATGAALAALDVLAREPDRLQRLRQNATALRTGLRQLGCLVPEHCSAIVPLPVGGEREAWTLSRRLLESGVIASAVTTPAVPRGKARLRLCAMAGHTASDIEAGLAAIARALEN